MNHQPDVMKLLTDARPVSLDPLPDAGRRARDIGLAIAVGSEIDSASPPRASLGASLRPDERSPRRAAARSAGRTKLGLGLAVTAGAAAVAVLVATAGNAAPPSATRHGASSTGHPASPGGGQPALSPAAVLLLAAANAAKAPSTGRYWHVIMTSRGIDPVAKGGVIGPPEPTGSLYAIDVRGRSQTWDALSPRDRSWLISQDLGAHPASAADEKAWRRDGAPTSWRLGLPNPVTHRPFVISMRPSPAQATSHDTNGMVGNIGKYRMTIGQLRALPANPAQLKSVIAEHVFRSQPVAPKVAPTDDEQIFQLATQLLYAPLTSQVRAALFHVLASLSAGVRAVGRIHDPLGRVGYGFAVPTVGLDAPGQEDLVVIDPTSGSLLAEEFVVTEGGQDTTAGAGYTWKAGQVISYTAVQHAGWTDATPTLPANQQAAGTGAG
jgi:hypothetical protein